MLITWAKPNIINAPDVCYYKLRVRSIDNANRFEKDLDTTFYYLRKEDLVKELEVKLSSINDPKCYKDKFQFATICKVEGSKELILKVPASDQSPNSNANMVFKNFNLILFALFSIYNMNKF